MRSRSLFAMLLVGLVGSAMAEPRREETSGRVRLNDTAGDTNAPRAPSAWVELASSTPAKHGTQFILIGEDAGGFGKLRLDAVKGGAIPVKQIRVDFADGKTKVYRLNKRIGTKRHKSLYVDLPTTKEISQIVVVTDSRSRGEYALYGSGTGGAIATR
jgi:hypothetical protein